MGQAAAAKKSGKDSAPAGYFQQTKDPFNSFILVLPLLLAYQAGLFAYGGRTANGADLSLLLVHFFGAQALLYFNGGLILVGVAGTLLTRSEGRFHPKLAAPIVLESTFYAVVMGIGISLIVGHLFPNSTAPGGGGTVQNVLLSLGAGVNEEFVFRLGLFAGGTALLKSLGTNEGTAGWVAVVVSSLLFAAVHHLSPQDPFSLPTFTFRVLAGMFFCGLFHLRGFAVAVYTHSIYDVLVLEVFSA